MGEAARRKLAGTYPTLAPAHPAPEPLNSPIPDDIRRDIAAAVRTVHLTQFGGSCIPRVLVGNAVLANIGIRPNFAIGGMLYRVGPELDRDVITFCNQGNVGTITDDGIFAGHMWLEFGGDLIDFSVGDWRHQAEGCYIAELMHNTQAGLPTLDRIQFDIEPPEFLWQSAASLKVGRSGAYPAIGKFWYTGWNDRNGKPDINNEDAIAQARMMLPATCSVATNLRLKERVAEWRAAA